MPGEVPYPNPAPVPSPTVEARLPAWQGRPSLRAVAGCAVVPCVAANVIATVSMHGIVGLDDPTIAQSAAQEPREHLPQGKARQALSSSAGRCPPRRFKDGTRASCSLSGSPSSASRNPATANASAFKQAMQGVVTWQVPTTCAASAVADACHRVPAPHIYAVSACCRFGVVG